MSDFAMKKRLSTSYEQTLGRVPDVLKAEGFGVLTEIDVQSTLKQKLGVEFRRYKILGACNPPFANEALQADLQAGLIMPCNVVVYEDDDHGTVVLVIDPTKTAAATGNPKLAAMAEALKQKLASALAKLD